MPSARNASGPPEIGPRPDLNRFALSVCIVGQDMAHRIAPLLDQASAVADEVVYVDGGSKDNSREVISRYPKARFIERRFDGNIGRQKNFALDQARCEWALILDTDELLGPKLMEMLPSILRSKAQTVKFPRYWLVDDAHYVLAKGIYPDRQLRLMRNRPELRYDESHPIHHPLIEIHREPCLHVKGGHLLHYCLMWQDRKTREEKYRHYAQMDPTISKPNRFYLYEDMPHRIAPCDEWWSKGRPMRRFKPTRAIVDRWRLWMLSMQRAVAGVS